MSALTQTTAYKIDPVHSSVRFSVRHLMITRVHGQFSAVAGTLEIPQGSQVPSSVDVTIDVASIDTREPQRDGHLKSADFFDAEHHPTITFRSTKIDGGDERFTIEGDLTIRGTTKRVVLDTTFEGAGNDAWGGYRVGYEASTKINRKDFGLNWNQTLESGGVVVGDEIKIELNVQAIRQG